MTKSSAHALSILDPSMSLDVNFEIYYEAYREYDSVYCIHLPMLTYGSAYGMLGVLYCTITHLLTPSVKQFLAHPRTQPITCPVAHLPTHPVTHPLTHLPTHPVTHPLPRLLTHLIIYPLPHLPTHPVTHPLPRLLTHPIIYPILRFLTHPLTRTPCNTGTIAHYRNASVECFNKFVPTSVRRFAHH